MECLAVLEETEGALTLGTTLGAGNFPPRLPALDFSGVVKNVVKNRREIAFVCF